MDAEKGLVKLQARVEAIREKHKSDVAHIQQHHPELAAFLTEMAEAFGKEQITYRAVLKR